MSSLLLRLAGPLQSWGTQSRFRYRDTGLEPSKSGVIGLLCAALGRSREASVDDLAGLLMGVRVNHEGSMRTDYQTVGGERSGTHRYGVAEFDNSEPDTVLSYRHYLADADFLVGLEAVNAAQENLLHTLDAALDRPVWPLYLGRKAFVPGVPVRLPDTPPYGPGLSRESLRNALLRYPWPADDRPGRLRFVFEDPEGQSGQSRLDVPVSFSPLSRRYMPRFVRTEFHERPTGVQHVEERGGAI